MTDLNDLLAHIPTDQIAARLGIDPDTADAAIRQVLPALVGGLHANAQDPAGAASLAGALGSHDPSLLDGGVNLDQVDTTDGAKIVSHVFGDNHDQVVSQLGGMGGASITSGLVGKLLPLLAPIVMSFLAKRLLGGALGGGSGASAGGSGGGGGLADILGSLLGGGSSAGSGGGSVGGFDLGSILGGLGGLLGSGTR
jgi:hypothetical protein